MRKVVAGLFMSLDGVAEAPNRFVFPFFSEEVGQAVGRNMDASDAMLLGRKTYEEWAAYWPDKTAEDDAFAPYINQIPKYVVSKTLSSVEWANSSLVSGDLVEAIGELKARPGKEIAVSGSITLVGSLLRQGLLDELSLMVFPVVVGSGKRLFEGEEQVPLRLLDSRTLDTGVLSLTYGRAES
jgi:dihydrofolate reductase